MPGRNIYKDYVEGGYYHIYNRGVDKMPIFLDEQDYRTFLALLKRYLGDEVELKPNRQPHPSFKSDVRLLAFCLMDNHFHLLVQQQSSSAIADFMKSLGIAYSLYFNRRYGRVGPLFQQRYRAVLIKRDALFTHISRYIHMNPAHYRSYEWSSLAYYRGERSVSWLRPEVILAQFPSPQAYLSFLAEYEHRRKELAQFKAELANA